MLARGDWRKIEMEVNRVLEGLTERVEALEEQLQAASKNPKEAPGAPKKAGGRPRNGSKETSETASQEASGDSGVKLVS